MKQTSIKKWEVKRRMEEIDRQLYWTGSIGRTQLIKRFGISPQQASADLKLYLEKAEDTVQFQGSIKQYVPTEEFKPLYFKPSIIDYITWTGEVSHEISTVPIPLRSADIEVLRTLTIAIHNSRSVNILYRSLTTPKGTSRRITPHSLVFTGTRYHVRAYCHQREGFRDFVLGRIFEAGDFGEAGPGKESDSAWNTLLIVSIGPHPKLEENQRAIIETDYSMVDGKTLIHIKQALLIYFLDQFNLDGHETERKAIAQQIILLNPEILSLVDYASLSFK